MVMLVSREAHPPRLVIFILGESDIVEITTQPFHRACHGQIGAGIILLVHGNRKHSQIRFVSREDNLFEDRKSTRLNSSHDQISYAVFCLKKKKNEADLN